MADEECIRDHAIVVDGVPVAAEAYYGRLCRKCYGRILHALEEAPDVAAAMRGHVVPGGSSGGQRVDGGERDPMPLVVDAVEDANDFYAQLADWTTNHAQRLGKRAPEPVLGLAVADLPSVGFRAGTGPVEAYELVATLTAWLRVHAESIAWLSSAGAYHDDLTALVRRYRSRYGLLVRRPRRARGRLCTVCFGRTVEARIYDGEWQVRCATCHQTVPIPWDRIEWEEAA